MTPAASASVVNSDSSSRLGPVNTALEQGPPPASSPRLAGTCHGLYVFDVGYEIDLERARERLSAAGTTRLRHKSASHTVAQSQSFPLIFEYAAPVGIPLPRLEGQTEQLHGELTISVYRVGALCVAWRLPFLHTLEGLVDLSVQLYGDTQFAEASRQVAQNIQESLGAAIERPRLQPEYEDYFVFQVRALEEPDGTQSPATAWQPTTQAASRRHLARLLRAEEQELSEQEIEDALARPISYAPGEVIHVDWLAALMIGNEVHDELFVLELATVELLELRLLDRQLFRGIDEAYEILAKQGRGLRLLSPLGGDLARIARIQADEAVLHEGVDNALKLFGDDYLARLYRAAQERFHFQEWDASIERKLNTLDSVHQKLSDLATWRRSEVLEWIIILLISAEILMSLVEKFA
jgi:hypothetical protein